jgi:energy-coupling factor transporter ATP-binding protein EcfA2
MSAGEDINERLIPFVETLANASSLNRNEAKLCLYYCILTHKIADLTLFPILTLYGEHGSGKSSLMKVIVQLVNKPVPPPQSFSDLARWEALKMDDTYPSLRDALLEDTTAFIEEGETDNRKNEALIANRYSRQTAAVRHKQQENVGYSQAKAHIFGATIIHKRRGYKDPATTSRSLFITTRKEMTKPHSNKVFTESGRQEFRAIAGEIPISKLTPNNRAQDLWYPLMGLAIYISDGEWMPWAIDELYKLTHRQTSGGAFDPQKALVLAILSNAVKEDANGNLLFSPDKYELSKIKGSLDQDLNVSMSINEIKHGLEQLDFEVKTRRGAFRVNVTGDKLRKVCSDLSIEDEAVKAIR